MHLFAENGSLVGFKFIVKENGPGSNHLRVHGFIFWRINALVKKISIIFRYV